MGDFDGEFDNVEEALIGDFQIRDSEALEQLDNHELAKYLIKQSLPSEMLACLEKQNDLSKSSNGRAALQELKRYVNDEDEEDEEEYDDIGISESNDDIGISESNDDEYEEVNMGGDWMSYMRSNISMIKDKKKSPKDLKKYFKAKYDVTVPVPDIRKFWVSITKKKKKEAKAKRKSKKKKPVVRSAASDSDSDSEQEKPKRVKRKSKKKKKKPEPDSDSDSEPTLNRLKKPVRRKSKKKQPKKSWGDIMDDEEPEKPKRRKSKKKKSEYDYSEVADLVRKYKARLKYLGTMDMGPEYFRIEDQLGELAEEIDSVVGVGAAGKLGFGTIKSSIYGIEPITWSSNTITPNLSNIKRNYKMGRSFRKKKNTFGRVFRGY